ncbi:feruloyl-CoA synthase [Undibacterium terreum]|uniref:Feruloyl-CoA synthase n=1 Tax=Undibacterium terreum TaxID=1224302 RepID=A0A916V0I5_9BURK|nr:feruloyl-CoA synthase [Undibacterium terreum]GGC97709.1 feruloyl-CoA synthase [Undibacterium terreum]
MHSESTTMAELNTSPVLFSEPQVNMTRREDGAIFLQSPVALEQQVRCLGEYLNLWAEKAPQRAFLLERNSEGRWAGVTYAQARDKVYRIATWLIGQGIGTDNPVVVLSDNSVEHALLMLACMQVGIPYSAISPAYSVVSRDHAKLKGLIRRLAPAVIYVADPVLFGPALAAIDGLHQATIVVADGKHAPPAGLNFSSLLGEVDELAVDARFAQVNHDTVAKILFTSGSTSEPKGVINTQRMLCSNQQGKLQVWPFLKQTPPVLLDWLPWNHTFGSNHNFNLILANGGTLYLDAGKPMPGLFDTSIANLRDVAPTMYLNVPRGFDMLVPMLRSDAALRQRFFSRLQVIFYAAAALPQHLWEALEQISREELGYVIPMVTAWGSTETAPLATDCNFQAERSGVIGLPIPGVTLKLLPCGEKLEVRVKGPNITPGYYKQPELSLKAFDDEGFYIMGDAVRFVDMARPHLGLIFDGRITEDFKLSSGTWVSVGALRLRVIEKMAPLVQDAIIAGHDCNDIRLLLLPNIAACRRLSGSSDDASLSEVLAHPAVRDHIRSALHELRNTGAGSSTYASRALFLQQPLSVDGSEITDKGYVNQAAVLNNRHHLVDLLYAEPADAELISL